MASPDSNAPSAPTVAPKLGKKLRARLLEIGREAIFYRLSRGSVPPFSITEPELQEKAAAFVSLHLDKDLRGCIGTLTAEHPLWEAVAEMSVAAATGDPRFPSLTTRDLPRTDLEISVLTPFVPIEPDAIIVGTHGLYLAKGPRRGVLLPQVAPQFGWSREEYLAQICRKAGLTEDAWRDKDTRLFSFGAEVFSNTSEAEDP